MNMTGYHGRFGAILGRRVEFQVLRGGPVHVGTVAGSTLGALTSGGRRRDGGWGCLLIVKDIRRRDGGPVGVGSWVYENPARVRVVKEG